jgi:DNA gyrase subunit A
MLTLKDMIVHFVAHRHEVVVRRTKYELREAEKRAHILEGLIIAVNNLDEVIRIIRESQTPDDAREELMTKFNLSDIQARAILDMRLRALTGLEIDKLKAEYEQLMKHIAYLKSILENEDLRMQIIKDELVEIRERYGDARRSEIVYAANDLRMEDMIADEEVVITISHLGYIKRTPLTEYRVQSRGGVGSRASTTRDEDFLEHIFVATNHNHMLFFTEKGRCFWLKVYEIPEGTKTSKGRAIQNLLQIESDDRVMAYMNVLSLKDEEYINNHFVIMCTKKGIIKKTTLEAYSRPRVNGINAIVIREDDQLLEARLTSGQDEIMLALKSGRAIRFNESKVRPMGRTASGVRGISIEQEDDEVVGMIAINEPSVQTVLVVSENGYGKRSFLNDPEDGEPVYRVTNRGGKGVKTINVTEKTGKLVAIKDVRDGDDLMIINRSGIAIRMAVDELRVMGRATQGVRLINLKGNDSIAAVAKVEFNDSAATVEGEAGLDAADGETSEDSPESEE